MGKGIFPFFFLILLETFRFCEISSDLCGWVWLYMGIHDSLDLLFLDSRAKLFFFLFFLKGIRNRLVVFWKISTIFLLFLKCTKYKVDGA